MKKYLALLLMMALTAAPSALAEDGATPLPLGVTLEMDGPALVSAIGGSAAFVPYFAEDDGETGTVQLSDVSLGIGDLTAASITFDVQRVNSLRVPRLSQISADLEVGEDSIAAFRAALEALTGVYGAPESDPFDASGVALYVEYGTLDASWVKEDVRISLSLQRMYEDTLHVSFSRRICFDAADLEA